MKRPIDNAYAYVLGKLALIAGNRKIDIDLVDRGLFLQKLLEKKGFYLIRKEEKPNATNNN